MSVRWRFYKNLCQNFSMENKDQVTLELAELWQKNGTPLFSLSKLFKKHGTYSQKMVCSTDGDGISQTIDISDIATANFGLVFYTYIVAGELNVKVETLDVDNIIVAEIFNKSYGSNSVITKQSDTFSASGNNYTQLKITFSYVAESGIEALTCYIDSVIMYEDIDTEVEINPTTFSYTKVSDSQFVKTIEGEDVKISPLEESKRTHLENFAPVWSWLTATQKDIFSSLIGEDIVIIDHADNVYWVDLLSMNIVFQEKQVPDKFAVTMELKESKR